MYHLSRKEIVEFVPERDVRYFGIHFASSESESHHVESIVDHALLTQKYICLKYEEVLDWSKKNASEISMALEQKEIQIDDLQTQIDSDQNSQEKEKQIAEMNMLRKDRGLIIASLYKRKIEEVLQERYRAHIEEKQKIEEELKRKKEQEEIEMQKQREKEQKIAEMKKKKQSRSNSRTSSRGSTRKEKANKEEAKEAEEIIEDTTQEDVQNCPTIEEKKEEFEDPTVAVFIFQDYPVTPDDVTYLIHGGVNFNAVILVSKETREGPRPLEPETPEEMEENKAGKNTKKNIKTKGKNPPSSKDKKREKPKSRGSKKKGKKGTEPQPETPLHVSLQEMIEDLTGNNTASCLRSISFFEQQFIEYQYDELTKEYNDGNDYEEECKKMIKNITEILASCVKFERDYKSQNGVKRSLFIPENTESLTLDYYRELIDRIPEQYATIPIILHCLIEQLIRNVEIEKSDNTQDDKKQKTQHFKEELSAVIDSALSQIEQVPQQQNHITPRSASSKSPREFFSIKNSEMLTSDFTADAIIIEHGDKIAENSMEFVEIQGIPTYELEYRMNKLNTVLSFNDQGKVNLTDEEKGIILTEIYNFVGRDGEGEHSGYLASKKQIEKELVLFRFEKMMKHSGTNANLSDRTYKEIFSHDVFAQILSLITTFIKPKVITDFYELEDSALVTYILPVPPEKYIEDSWVKCFTVPPSFAEWSEKDIENLCKFQKDSYETKYKETSDRIAAEREKALLEKAAKESSAREKQGKTQKDTRKEEKKENKKEESEEADMKKETDNENEVKQIDGEDGQEKNTESIEESKVISTGEDEIKKIENDEPKPPPVKNLQRKPPTRDLKMFPNASEVYVYEKDGSIINEDSIMLFPDDGAVIHILSLLVTEKKIYSTVHKDGMVFGMKSKLSSERFGIRCFFTCSFEDECTLSVLQCNENEEIVFETAKIGLGDNNTNDTEKKSVEQSEGNEIENKEHSDQKITEKKDEVKNTEISFGCPNGLYLRLTMDGSILQTYPQILKSEKSVFGSGFVGLKKNKKEEMLASLHISEELLDVWNEDVQETTKILVVEKARYYLVSGAVIRTFDAGDVMQVINERGEVCTSNAHSMWLKTNPNGERYVLTPKEKKIVRSLNIATNTDTPTKAKVSTREDLVMTVEYPDGTTLVQHNDGTRFWKYIVIDGEKHVEKILIEKPPYSPVEIERHRDDDKINETISCELFDQGLIKYHLHNNVKIMKHGHTIDIHPESKIIDIEPSSLLFQKKRSSKYRYGVYSFNYSTGSMKTLDLRGNIFLISGYGRTLIKYHNIIYPEQDRNPHHDHFFNDELERKEFNHKRKGLPPVFVQGKSLRTLDIHPPRVFSVHIDGYAIEYLQEEDVKPFLKAAKLHKGLTMIEEKKGESGVSSITCLTRREKLSILQRPVKQLPSSLLPLRSTNKGEKKALYLREFLVYDTIPEEIRQKMKQGFEQWKKWSSQKEETLKRQEEESKQIDSLE